ncbi:MAG: hypothetical protein UC708_04110, partial [Anaerovoracaceae bacterium]|nr:hypothetical protein [Anaerovoracaceae bacterium]
VEYLGKYDYYMEKKEQIQSGKKYLEDMVSSENSKAELSAEEKRRMKKAEDAQLRRKNRLKESLEEEIEQLEKKIAELEEQMCLPDNIADYEKLERLGNDLSFVKEQHEDKLEEWLELSE